MPAEQEGPEADSSPVLVIRVVGGEQEPAWQRPPQVPCVPEPCHELGQSTALLVLILYPGLLTEAPGRAARASALLAQRMRNYCAKAEQDFLLLAVFSRCAQCVLRTD